MPLVLMRNFEAPQDTTDYYLTSGDLRVGRIYERHGMHGLEFLWALNGVFGGPHEMRVAGMAATFDQAQAALQENWEKWLAWAKLQELSGPAPQSLDEPPQPPDSDSGKP
jgi:hypothetical protein